MSGQDDTTQLDETRIVLPSDRITLGQMRTAEPEVFTLKALQSDTVSSCDALATRAWELILAEKAFARAAGRPNPYPEHKRRYIIEELLHEAYQSYGLSQGLHESRQLVRQIEQAAVRQLGHSRNTGD